VLPLGATATVIQSGNGPEPDLHGHVRRPSVEPTDDDGHERHVARHGHSRDDRGPSPSRRSRSGFSETQSVTIAGTPTAGTFTLSGGPLTGTSAADRAERDGGCGAGGPDAGTAGRMYWRS